MARTRLGNCKASERGATVSRRAPVSYDCCISKEEIERLISAESKYLSQVLAVPRQIALDKKITPAVRLSGSQQYLDRQIGKVAEKREHSGGFIVRVEYDDDQPQK